MDVKATRAVSWKCYENIFDGAKSGVMKVDEEGWLEEKGRKETDGEVERKRRRTREREGPPGLLERNVYACRT